MTLDALATSADAARQFTTRNSIRINGPGKQEDNCSSKSDFCRWRLGADCFVELRRYSGGPRHERADQKLNASTISSTKPKKGGNLYASLSANSFEDILPALLKRFPGIAPDHTGAAGAIFGRFGTLRGASASPR
jgi:hypothetical protein